MMRKINPAHPIVEEEPGRPVIAHPVVGEEPAGRRVIGVLRVWAVRRRLHGVETSTLKFKKLAYHFHAEKVIAIQYVGDHTLYNLQHSSRLNTEAWSGNTHARAC
jgi:hypothetical protein